jgi:hypothetical protein
MNFRPTILKNTVSLFITIVSGYYSHPILTICSVEYCPIDYFKIYTLSLLIGLSVGVLVYGVWSVFSKKIIPSSLVLKVLAIIATIGISILILGFAYIGLLKWPSVRGESQFPQVAKPQI